MSRERSEVGGDHHHHEYVLINARSRSLPKREQQQDGNSRQVGRLPSAPAAILSASGHTNNMGMQHQNAVAGNQSRSSSGHAHHGPPAAGTGLIVTPCAACKLLRRRCAHECPFAPYFSPHEPHKFASVHKIYGASNVSKMLMEVPESQRADTANSLVYEANARMRDPVFGCTGLISTLQQQARSLQAELNAVKAEVMHYRASHAETAANLNLLQMASPPAYTNPTNNITTSNTPPLPGENITYIAPSTSTNNSSSSQDSAVKVERFWSSIG